MSLLQKVALAVGISLPAFIAWFFFLGWHSQIDVTENRVVGHYILYKSLIRDESIRLVLDEDGSAACYNCSQNHNVRFGSWKIHIPSNPNYINLRWESPLSDTYAPVSQTLLGKTKIFWDAHKLTYFVRKE